MVIFYRCKKGENMKAAIIGLGVIGKVHYDVLKRQGEDIVALCDIDAAKLNGYDNVKKYFDYKKMLDEEQIDVVHICTPHYLHADMTIYALERNVNVLCEKPLCIRKEDVARIIDAENKSKAMLGVCLQNRFNKSSQFVKRYFQNKKVDFAFGNVLWHRDKEYYASGEWRGKKETEGGGVLINQAIHTLDLMQWICGEPTSVLANTYNYSLKDVIEVEDTAVALFKGDTDFEFFATNTAKTDLPVEIRFIAGGDIVTLYPDKVLINGDVADIENEIEWNGKRSYGNGHEKLIGHFYDCVAKKEKFPIDGSEAAKCVKEVLSAYESDGKLVEI